MTIDVTKKYSEKQDQLTDIDVLGRKTMNYLGKITMIRNFQNSNRSIHL